MRTLSTYSSVQSRTSSHFSISSSINDNHLDGLAVCNKFFAESVIDFESSFGNYPAEAGSVFQEPARGRLGDCGDDTGLVVFTVTDVPRLKDL